MFRKHIFSTGKVERKNKRCVYCYKKRAKVKKVPRREARCKDSPVRAGFFEWLFNSINCLGRWRWMIVCPCGKYMGSVVLSYPPGKTVKKMVIWKTCEKCKTKPTEVMKND